MKLGLSAFPNAILYPLFVHRRTPAKPSSRVAIIKLGKLGDNVLALGAIKLLVEHYGAKNCTIVSSLFARDLIAYAFPTVEILTVTTNHSTLRKTLRDLFRLRRHSIFCEGVDVLVSLQHHRTLHDDLIASAIPASTTWGLPNSELGKAGLSDQIIQATYPFDNRTELPAIDPQACRELELHAVLLSSVLGRTVTGSELRPRIHSRAAAPSEAIGLAPFSGSVLRDVPMPLLSAASRWARKMGLAVHVWSPHPRDPRTAAMVERLKAETSADVHLVHTPSTADFIRAIAAVRLVVAAESAPAHLATAMDQPLVAIIGGGHFGWFAPWTTSHRQKWLFSRETCFSCNWVCVHAEPICVTRVPVADFAQALEDVVEPLPRPDTQRAAEAALR